MSKLDALWNYQTAELKKEALDREVLNTPSRAQLKKLHVYLKEQQAAITNVQADILSREEAVQKLQDQLEKLARDIELERAEFEQMEKEDDVTAAEVTESRQNHERLLRQLERSRKELGKLMRGLEQSLESYTAIRKKANTAKKQYDQLRVVCEQELKESEGTRKEAENAVAAQAAKVDASLLERYRHIKRNHTMPVAKVENNQCGGCNMSLPMVVVRRVTASDALVECENCGRILYVSD